MASNEQGVKNTTIVLCYKRSFIGELTVPVSAVSALWYSALGCAG